MNYLNIFSNCQLVRGATMSLICDLQLRKYYHVPNDMADVLDFLSARSIEECYEEYGKGNKSIIKSYLNFILKNDMGFIDEQLISEMTALSLEWDAYSDITNVIIEVSPTMVYDTSFLTELIDLNLIAVEIRAYEEISYEKLNQVLSLFIHSTALSMKIVLKWAEWCTDKTLLHIMENNLRINMIILHSAPIEETKKIFKDSAAIVYRKASLNSCLACGVIHPSYFSTSIELFTESQLHNTCLNRKLSIDKDGFIKNCPSMQTNFGQIHQTTLRDVLANPAFKENWLINKDKINVCRDCEFRHVCTDCRAFTERTHSDANGRDLSKPLKCGYDPYLNRWEDWTRNPLKSSAISYYNMEDLINEA